MGRRLLLMNQTWWVRRLGIIKACWMYYGLTLLMADMAVAHRPPSVFSEQGVYDHVQLVHCDVIMRRRSKFQYNHLMFWWISMKLILVLINWRLNWEYLTDFIIQLGVWKSLNGATVMDRYCFGGWMVVRDHECCFIAGSAESFQGIVQTVCWNSSCWNGYWAGSIAAECVALVWKVMQWIHLKHLKALRIVFLF